MPKAKHGKRIQEEIEQGVERTVSEWAEALYGEITHRTVNNVWSVIGDLRRKNVMAFTIEKGDKKILKIVNRDQTMFSIVYNNYVKTQAEARLLSSFHIAEVFLTEHPKMREKIVERSKAILQLAADQQKHLLGIEYIPSNKALK